MDRINVVGTSCSGKTTLARAIGARIGASHVELDALYWGPGWEPVPADVFRARVERAVAGERWVMDGGYSMVRRLIWERADTIVWLDYPMPIVLARWARRTVARIRSREEFWPGTGNRESVANVLRRDGLLWWILSTHRGRRARTAAALESWRPRRVIHLRSPAATAAWLRQEPWPAPALPGEPG